LVAAHGNEVVVPCGGDKLPPAWPSKPDGEKRGRGLLAGHAQMVKKNKDYNGIAGEYRRGNHKVKVNREEKQERPV